MIMFSGYTFFCYCIITIFVVGTPSRHLELNIVQIFLVPEALLRCREAKQLLRAQLWLIIFMKLHYWANFLKHFKWILNFSKKRVTSSVYAIAYLEHAQLLHRRLSAECTECGCLHLHSGRHSRTSNPEMSCTECGCLHLHSVRHSPTSNPEIGVYRVRVLAFAQRLQFPHIKSCKMVS